MIYADYASTTPVCKEALLEMEKYFSVDFANASSVHTLGRQSAVAVENARKRIADVLGVKKNEIFFTSGGTESDNWAIRGILARTDKRHIITTCIEHHAVLNTLKALERDGVRVTYLPVDASGRISLKELEDAVCPDTALISIMYATNEIGAVQDIEAIGEIAKKYSVPFHTDAVQALCHRRIRLDSLNVSLMSVSAHKFYGPKGIGILCVRSGTQFAPMILGGSQEMDMRAGTVNTPLIMGMATALEQVQNNVEELENIAALRADHVRERVLSSVSGVRVFSGQGIGSILSLGFENVLSEGLTVLLDMLGVCVSSGAACSAGTVKTSHVIKALVGDKADSYGVIRISLSHLTTEDEAEAIAQRIIEAVASLRK